MAPLTPEQLRRRDRVEGVIGLMAPFLNLLLAAGERVSRIVEPEDRGYYPAQVGQVPEPERIPGSNGDAARSE